MQRNQHHRFHSGLMAGWKEILLSNVAQVGQSTEVACAFISNARIHDGVHVLRAYPVRPLVSCLTFSRDNLLGITFVPFYGFFSDVSLSCGAAGERFQARPENESEGRIGSNDHGT